MDEGASGQSADLSAYQVDITYQDAEPVVDSECIIAAVRHTLIRHGCKQAQLSIALVNDDCISRLNEQHLGHTGPTDVLSFDLNGDRRGDSVCFSGGADVVDSADGADAEHAVAVIDGEIVLSLQTAQREAQRRGHSMLAEVVLYAVHGTLHLLGHDDCTVADAARMHEIEDDILAELGFGRVFRGTLR